MEAKEQGCRTSRWELLKQKLNNLDPLSFREAIEKNDGYVLIDCRRKEEFSQGYLPEALNIDYLSYEFLDELEKLHPEKKYLVYCRSGRRSIRTCTLMQNSGFNNVYNLDGGLNRWDLELGPADLIRNL